MSRGNLATYLNDHLAGSVVALELLEHLEKFRAGSSMARFFAELRLDILNDRQELETLMGSLRIPTSPPRKAMAWLTEKFTELRLRLDDSRDGTLHLLEAVEAIAIGIEGKRALWSALAAARIPELHGTDCERLERRAREQRDRVEKVRLDAAKNALDSNS
jgi:hypothetical protein